MKSQFLYTLLHMQPGQEELYKSAPVPHKGTLD